MARAVDQRTMTLRLAVSLTADFICRTAVYVIRMSGGVGGEEPRGSPLSRCAPGMGTDLEVRVLS